MLPISPPTSSQHNRPNQDSAQPVQPTRDVQDHPQILQALNQNQPRATSSPGHRTPTPVNLQKAESLSSRRASGETSTLPSTQADHLSSQGNETIIASEHIEQILLKNRGKNEASSTIQKTDQTSEEVSASIAQLKSAIEISDAKTIDASVRLMELLTDDKFPILALLQSDDKFKDLSADEQEIKARKICKLAESIALSHCSQELSPDDLETQTEAIHQRTVSLLPYSSVLLLSADKPEDLSEEELEAIYKSDKLNDLTDKLQQLSGQFLQALTAIKDIAAAQKTADTASSDSSEFRNDTINAIQTINNLKNDIALFFDNTDLPTSEKTRAIELYEEIIGHSDKAMELRQELLRQELFTLEAFSKLKIEEDKNS